MTAQSTIERGGPTDPPRRISTHYEIAALFVACGGAAIDRLDHQQLIEILPLLEEGLAQARRRVAELSRSASSS
jgi:hypothetical protein